MGLLYKEPASQPASIRSDRVYVLYKSGEPTHRLLFDLTAERFACISACGEHVVKHRVAASNLSIVGVCVCDTLLLRGTQSFVRAVSCMVRLKFWLRFLVDRFRTCFGMDYR